MMNNINAGVAEWCSHGFVNRRREFDSPLRPHRTGGSEEEQLVDNRQVVGSIPTPSTKRGQYRYQKRVHGGVTKWLYQYLFV